MLLLDAASSMNCSVLCTAPVSSRYFSLRSRCDFASVAVCQAPLRLNSHAEDSSLDIKLSISAHASVERGAAGHTVTKVYANRESRKHCMTVFASDARRESDAILHWASPDVVMGLGPRD